MSETEAIAAPAVQVAQDLTAIVELSDDLLAEAVIKASDPLMPGGLAMVALGHVSSLEEWAETLEAAEHRHSTDPKRWAEPVIEDDDEWEPPLQTLLFWSEAWRTEHGYPLAERPTLASEANFIRWALGWAWDNELHWDDFAADIRKAKSRLEDLLKEGLRSSHGVPCFDCNVDLIRPSRPPREVRWCEGHEGVCTWPHRFCAHDRGGLADEWKCPSCDRRYGVEDYARAVRSAHYAHADYLAGPEAALRTGVTLGKIRVWAHRGKVPKRIDRETRRVLYHVPSIEAAEATRREDGVA